jgi:hypothetical protein
VVVLLLVIFILIDEGVYVREIEGTASKLLSDVSEIGTTGWTSGPLPRGLSGPIPNPVVNSNGTVPDWVNGFRCTVQPV